MTADPNATVTRRVARKQHRDDYGHTIRPGDTYLLHKCFPGHDAGYADAAGRPVTLPECAECARRYGRGHLIDAPITGSHGCLPDGTHEQGCGYGGHG